MKAVIKVMTGAAGVAALVGMAAPAAAQYYPGYGSGGYGNSGIGAIIDAILRGGNRYSGYGGYGGGVTGQQVVSQCTAAVQQRLGGGYGAYGNPYGAYGNPYGASGGGYGGGRVVNVTHADRHGSTIRVRGYATSGMNAGYGGYGAYGGGYGGAYAAPVADLKFRCDVDYYGRIRNIDINRNREVSGGH